MITKKPLLCALGMIAAGTSVAAPGAKNMEFVPDYIIDVPLKLEGIPQEIHTVVVWCDILNVDNKTGGARGADLKSLANGGHTVVAQTGSVEIKVNGLPLPTEGQGGKEKQTTNQKDSTAYNWKVPNDRLYANVADKFGNETALLKDTPTTFFLPTEYQIDPVWMPSQPKSARPLIPPKNFSKMPVIGNNPIVRIHASVQGATDPKLGAAYACYMGFKARAEVNGRMQDFTVFAPDPNTYTGMLAKGERPQGPKYGYGDSRSGVQELSNPNKVLTVVGFFPPSK